MNWVDFSKISTKIKNMLYFCIRIFGKKITMHSPHCNRLDFNVLMSVKFNKLTIKLDFFGPSY